MPTFPSMAPAGKSQASLLVTAWVLTSFLGALAFGGASPVATPALAAAAALLAAFTLAGTPTPKTFFSPLVTAVLLLPVAWGIFQILPAGHLPLLGNLANPLWTQAAATANFNAAGSVSLNPPAGLDGLARGIAYLAAFAAAAVLGRTMSGASLLLQGLALSGIAVCTYGLATAALGNTDVLTLPKSAYFDSLTASFINRNSFATFAGLTTLTCLAVLLERLGEVPGPGRAKRLDRWRAFVNLTLMPRWGYLAGALIAFSALVLSHSRAGLACTLLGALIFIGSLSTSRRGSKGMLVATTLAVLLVASTVFSFLGEGVGERFARGEGDANLRQTLYAVTGRAVMDNALLGTGIGTFEDVFRIYRTPELPLNIGSRVDHAHNTWLQLALELGLPAFLPLPLLALWLGSRYVKGIRTRRRGVVFPSLGLAAITLVGTHALVDFSLEIPAVTLLTALIAGATLGQSRADRSSATDLPPPPRTHLPHLMLAGLAAAALLVNALSTAQALSIKSSSLTVYALRQGNTVSTADLVKARAALLANPTMPDWLPATSTREQALQNLTLLDLILGNRLLPGAAVTGQALLLSTDTHARAALAMAPANPYTWYRLARARALTQNVPDAAPAMALSLITGPWEPQLVWGRLPLLSQMSQNLSPDDQALFANSLHQAWTYNASRMWQVARQNPQLAGQLAQAIAGDAAAIARWPAVTGRAFPLAETAPAGTPPDTAPHF